MAFKETRRISPHILKADQDAYVSLTGFRDYRPAKPSYTPEELAKVLEAEWHFHNAMLDAKLQVIAQYGDSSDEVQSLGLKKKSERRRPGRRVAQSRSA